MPSPTATDGAARTLEELVIPGVFEVLTVGLANHLLRTLSCRSDSCWCNQLMARTASISSKVLERDLYSRFRCVQALRSRDDPN